MLRTETTNQRFQSINQSPYVVALECANRRLLNLGLLFDAMPPAMKYQDREALRQPVLAILRDLTTEIKKPDDVNHDFLRNILVSL